MGVGWSDVPRSVVFQDIDFMNMEGQMRAIKQQIKENDEAHDEKNKRS